MHIIKTSDKPFFAFLSGNGGVGKSHLIKSIYQAALKYYNATTIKPVTTQFAVGRTKSVQVVRKQFPLRPPSAKTVHRSQDIH